jgi:hypothetical protein
MTSFTPCLAEIAQDRSKKLLDFCKTLRHPNEKGRSSKLLDQVAAFIAAVYGDADGNLEMVPARCSSRRCFGRPLGAR